MNVSGRLTPTPLPETNLYVSFHIVLTFTQKVETAANKTDDMNQTQKLILYITDSGCRRL